jgi:uncharacterized protein
MDELFDAIRRGDSARVNALVKANPGALSAKSNNVSAVLTALYNGQNDVARLLVELGAPLDLHDACATGDLDRVRRMLAEDPSLLDQRSADGFPPLGLAIFFRQPDVAKFLIERGADVNAVAENAQRVAPVHAAAAVRDHQSMRMLLERGADPNAKQQMDVTPLHGAASRGDIDMAKLLLAHGADPHAVMSDGTTISALAEKYKQDEFAKWFVATRR